MNFLKLRIILKLTELEYLDFNSNRIELVPSFDVLVDLQQVEAFGGQGILKLRNFHKLTHLEILDIERFSLIEVVLGLDYWVSL